jgi:hypothetical protein
MFFDINWSINKLKIIEIDYENILVLSLSSVGSHRGWGATPTIPTSPELVSSFSDLPI